MLTNTFQTTMLITTLIVSLHTNTAAAGLAQNGSVAKPAKIQAEQAFQHAEGPAELSLVPWQQLELDSTNTPIIHHENDELFQKAVKTIRRSDVQHDLRSPSTQAPSGNH